MQKKLNRQMTLWEDNKDKTHLLNEKRKSQRNMIYKLQTQKR